MANASYHHNPKDLWIWWGPHRPGTGLNDQAYHRATQLDLPDIGGWWGWEMMKRAGAGPARGRWSKPCLDLLWWVGLGLVPSSPFVIWCTSTSYLLPSCFNSVLVMIFALVCCLNQSGNVPATLLEEGRSNWGRCFLSGNCIHNVMCVLIFVTHVLVKTWIYSKYINFILLTVLLQEQRDLA